MKPGYFTNPISLSIRWTGSASSFTKRIIGAAFACLLLAANWGCGTAGKPSGFGSGEVPQITSFIATPATITNGAKSVLSWSVSGATSMSISTGSGNLAGSSGTTSSNSITVSPTTTTTYTLTATNQGGQSSSASVTLSVVDKPVINSFTANPSLTSDTQGTTLSWNVTSATNLSINQGVGDVSGTSSVNVNPAKTTTYLLTATNSAAGGTSSASVVALTTVTVVPAPTITNFTASPATISGGQSSTLSWSVSGATGLSIDHGVGAVTGSSVNVSPTATTTYTLTAGNASGGFTATSTAQAMVTFSSAAVPTINSFTTDHPSVGPNGTVKLTANFDLGQGGGTATITNGATVISTGSSSPMTATLPVSSSTTFTLTAKNVDGNTATATVRVLAGTLAVFAGDPNINGFSDSPPRFDRPGGIAVDASGNIYIADTGNHTIRQITNSGGTLTVSTLAGTPQMSGNMDGDGSTALFNGPTGLAVDASGNIFVADTGNNTIREITVSGGAATVSTLMDSSTGMPAQFNGPQDVALDNLGNVYVADSVNDTIDMVTPAGAVSVFAGVTGFSGHSDSPNAHFNFPYGIVMDPASANLYVADSGNNTIRKITVPGGVVSTLAGNATQPHGSADGTGAAALFYSPNAISVDPAGNLYVVDVNNFTIRRITPAGQVVTIIGVAGQPGALVGPLPARLGVVRGIAVDPAANGNLYFNMLHAVYTAPY